MATVCFLGTYPPLKCGIADYTEFLTRADVAWQWRVLSFRLDDGQTLASDGSLHDEGHVWYGLPRRGLSAGSVLRGLAALGVAQDDAALWFQHEFGIWEDSREFIDTLRGLDLPKIVSLHTLRFQSRETPSGLCRREHDLLRDVLPHVDAITVFSQGVYSSVTEAFPEHRAKIHVLKHGVHSYPDISHLTRAEAKRILHEFLVGNPGLDEATRRALRDERVLLDPDAIVIGQTGFLHPIKGSEHLFPARDKLQELLPDRRVAAMRIGGARLDEHLPHVYELRRQQDGQNKFLVELWLPRHILPLAQRALDVNYYWPSDCTQSGMLAHALGAGALIAGRDLESVGEMLKEAGALCDTDGDRLVRRIREVVLNPPLRKSIEDSAVAYAAGLSWERQARRHHDLAHDVLPRLPVRAASAALTAVGRIGALLTRWNRTGDVEA